MPLPYQYEAAVSMIQGYQDLPPDGFPKIMHFFYYLFVVLPVYCGSTNFIWPLKTKING